MNMLQLQYFVASAQTLNFTAAANRNYVTQPTICRQIDDLEARLGAKLFNRSTHGISLTSAGHEFYDYAISILHQTEQATTRVRNMEEGRAGFVRISALPTSVAELTECISVFSNQYPDVQVDIELPTGSGQITAISRASHDFYFAFSTMFERKNYLEYVNTLVDRYCLALHKKYADDVDPNNFSTLSKWPFVMISQSTGPAIYGQTIEICKVRGLDPKVINYYTHAAATLISVNAGVGITILPMSLTGSSISDNIVVFPIEGVDATVSYSIAWLKQNPNKAASRFKEVVLGLYQ